MIEPNRTFQHYEVLRRDDGSPWELGRGAMGITYKAFDVNLCCEVALKVVNSALLDHPDVRERFVREARAAAALRHRNVASVYHLGNDGEHFFYAMEFIDGETLDALVRRQGPLPVDVVLRMVGQVSRALAAADRQHLVHRDIKPTNLMVVHEDADEETTIKVIDFGLARPAIGSETTAQVTLGGFVGTPQYASPEQLEERGLDARSDIYSLGVTAWYLLTGAPPFTGSLASVCQQQLGHPPPWEILPLGLPGCVHDLLAHMLEKNPDQRPQNARALREEVEECSRAVPASLWHLPPLGSALRADSSPATAKVRTSASGRSVANTLAAGRYTLLRLLEEGHGTQVYQARDERSAAHVVTLRTLPFQMMRDDDAQAAVVDEIRLIQATTHPHLVRLLALEPASDKVPAFLVEESLAGFSLRDLLAGGGGTLPVADTLRLLEQAAEAADHAESRRLEHLDLALHHLQVHFPFSSSSSGPDDSRSFLTLPMERWPEWSLKVHPFTVERGTLEHHTWAGDVTLVPGTAAQDTGSHPDDPAAARYVQRLANLAYELLGGTPLANAGGAPSTRNVSLPCLNEAGNTVLAKALFEPAVFADCHGFLAAFTAVGEHPAVRAKVDFAPLPVRAGNSIVGVDSIVTPEPLPLEAKILPRPTRATSLPADGASSRSSTPPPPPTTVRAAPLSQVHEVITPVLGESAALGTAWERLAMVGGEPAHPGRWLFGAIVVVVAFVAVFAGVLVLLLQGGRARKTPVAKANIASRSTATTTHAQRFPTPFPAGPVRTIRSPLIVSAPPLPTPVTSPLVMVRDVKEAAASPAPFLSSPATASLASAATPPPASATPEKLVAVQLDSVPRGAEVRLRGQLLGITPLEAHLPPGDHQLVTNFHGWPETRKTIHLDSGQTRVTVEIPLMPPGLVPLYRPAPGSNVRSPATDASAERRAARSTNSLVEPAIPVVSPTGDAAPTIRRPLPLEPFDRQTTRTETHRLVSPAPSAADDGED